MSKRKDTTLASSGSEFLVLGELLIREIESYKTYHNQKAYDIISVNPETKRNATIQVKCKNYKNDFGFYLNNVNKICDFYVFCATQIYHYVKNDDGKRVSELIKNNENKPRFFIMDFETTQKYKRTDRDGSDYIQILTDAPFEEFENNWYQIKDYLSR